MALRAEKKLSDIHLAREGRVEDGAQQNINNRTIAEFSATYWSLQPKLFHQPVNSLNSMAKVLLTGGAGYIGSHACLVLLKAGHDLIVLDNYSNSSPSSLDRVEELAKQSLSRVCGDIRDSGLLDKVFTDSARKGAPIEAVIHFAGLKAVSESLAQPLPYWDVNLCGSRVLLAAMDAHDCRTLVFSSTSTVYGAPTQFPLVESMVPAPIHPYAQSKLAVEQLLNALAAKGSWRIANLRYFNPVGAHPSGRIGEDPHGIPNNLFPYITQIAAGRLSGLSVFGNDYPTPDGTGIRDYLHVMDLAEAHASALDHLLQNPHENALTLNLGTGQGLSVLDVVHGFERATGITIPYTICARRPGDVPRLECSPKKAQTTLGWRAQRSLRDMCRDAWAWQSANPNGYSA